MGERRDLMFLVFAGIVAALGSSLQYSSLARPFPYFYQMITDFTIVLLCLVLCVKSLRRDEPAWLGIACLSAIVGTTHLLRMLYGGLLC
jgi:hypothetical protein